MSRPRRRLLVVLGIVAFLAISVEVTRYLAAQSDERTAIYGLLQDQVHGDGAAMARRFTACDTACRGSLDTLARRLRRPGKARILLLSSAVGNTLGTEQGRSRIAWAASVQDRIGPAVVQCVTVRRHWGPFSSASTSLLRLSAPIDPQSGC